MGKVEQGWEIVNVGQGPQLSQEGGQLNILPKQPTDRSQSLCHPAILSNLQFLFIPLDKSTYGDIFENMVSLGWVGHWLYSQYFKSFPVPSKRYTGQTIIVTGSNVGLGLEAARHFVRLDAQRVILGVRNRSKGENAAKSIESSTGRKGVVEVWDLDLSSYTNTKAFADRALNLPRLDVFVGNAGIFVYDFAMAEDNESTITVNVVSGYLLALLILPKLRETSVQYKKETVLTFTGSFVHFLTKFPERKAPNILKGLAVKDKAIMNDRFASLSLNSLETLLFADPVATRYNVSKLVQLLLSRELANQISASSKPGEVTVNNVNPGFVTSEIMRNNASSIFQLFFPILRVTTAHSTEKGSRTIMHGAAGGKETHGQYLSECEVAR